MSTLAEIEEAAVKLPTPELETLVAHLAARLQQQRGEERANDLAPHSGVLRLAEDPLEWQQQVRGEWR